jgi:predicted O-methyltransferase YrrM
MTKMRKLFRIFKVLLKNPNYLQRVIDREAEKKNYVIKNHGCEYGLPTIDLLDMFPRFEETVEPYSFLEGNSLPIDLALLKALARNYDHCRYLEIGTWRGESAANVANVAEECISVDLSEEEMKQRRFSNQFIANIRFYSRGYRNISYIAHNSQTFDFSSLGKFDMIFIDGDHSYESVKTDTQNAFKLLRDNNSVIVWHDYGATTERVMWSVLAGILDGCPEEKRGRLYHISNSLCAIYINGMFNTTFEMVPQIPNKSFTVKISAVKI